MLKRYLLTVLCSATLFVAPAYADVNMKPGLWEQTTKVQMEGMPMPMQEVRNTYCLKKEDLVPQKNNQSGCKVSNVRTSGNTVTWDVQCNNNGTKSSGNGTITYSGTTSKGRMTFTVDNPSTGPMTMHHEFTAKRIGECR